MNIKLPAQVNKAIAILHQSGFQAYVVGGCVRDYLLLRTPKDFDITTDACPEALLSLFSDYKVIETGLKHGTITVIIDSWLMEITTYRVESTYSDNRHPDSVRFISRLEDDLARRDFTINAIAYNEDVGLIDPFDGIDDIHNQIIRCVGEADQRFAEDALRIMRAIRFASVLGFQVEKQTKAAIFRNKERLEHIAKERLRDELMGLLAGEQVKDIILEYIDVIGVFIPELLSCKDFDQCNRYHIYDVLTHTAVAVEHTALSPAYLRLAALFHDIGKPPSFSVGKDGAGHFYGHGAVSAKMTKAILRRLKMDRFTIYRVCLLIQYHDATINPTVKSVKRWLGRLTPQMFCEWLQLHRGDRLAQHPDHMDLANLDEISKIAEEIIARQDCLTIKDLKINGDNLVALGFPRGPQIGQVLRDLLMMVMDEQIENEYTALMEKAKSLL